MEYRTVGCLKNIAFKNYMRAYYWYKILTDAAQGCQTLYKYFISYQCWKCPNLHWISFPIVRAFCLWLCFSWMLVCQKKSAWSPGMRRVYSWWHTVTWSAALKTLFKNWLQLQMLSCSICWKARRTPLRKLTNSKLHYSWTVFIISFHIWETNRRWAKLLALQSGTLLLERKNVHLSKSSGCHWRLYLWRIYFKLRSNIRWMMFLLLLFPLVYALILIF